ncbi:hypothetical protein GCK32_002520 [Trichostrongylus colubriformis]|uniref:Uncharacterized protein n=1 Tax=Trichostrongylus colubriformis TaxID=6319 RepID=A0AAN8IV32_TRICO
MGRSIQNGWLGSSIRWNGRMGLSIRLDGRIWPLTVSMKTHANKYGRCRISTAHRHIPSVESLFQLQRDHSCFAHFSYFLSEYWNKRSCIIATEGNVVEELV